MTKAETLKKEKERVDEDDTFEKDISINKYKLDEECLSHASRYAYYAEASAVAKANVSEAKDRLELVEAELYDAIKDELEKKGTKTTIPMLEKALIMDEQVIEAKKALREAELVSSRLQVSVSAMDARRSELDNLVKLYVAGYFSTADGAGVKKSANEQASRDARKNLNR